VKEMPQRRKLDFKESEIQFEPVDLDHTLTAGKNVRRRKWNTEKYGEQEKEYTQPQLRLPSHLNNLIGKKYSLFTGRGKVNAEYKPSWQYRHTKIECEGTILVLVFEEDEVPEVEAD
jgi:hypothetical protein